MGVQLPLGGGQSQLPRARQVPGKSRRRGGRQSAHFARHVWAYGRQEGYLLSAEVRLFGDALEVSGDLGGRLQRRRGAAIGWTAQADSGGRLHVNRSGSKSTTREAR